MRFLVSLLLALPLCGQTFFLQNQSNQDLDELEIWEQKRAIVKQVRDLYIAGVSGTYTFDVAAEVCLDIREQVKTDYPTLARVTRSGDETRACRVELTGPKARFMWDGWDWNEPAGGDGTTITVCASGCNYTTLQAAWDNHTFGDLIEVSVETFGSAATGTILSITPDHTFTGSCPTYTVIQPASYGANFAPGVRVSASDAANMPNLIGGATAAPPNHPIRLEDTQGPAKILSSVNTSTETFTTTQAHGFSVNDEVIWVNNRLVGDWDDVTEMGLSPFVKYYIKTVPTTTTFTLSRSVGGATVDIAASPGSVGNNAIRKWNDAIHCLRINGLEIETADGQTGTQSIISMYDRTAFPEQQMSHIIFRHLWLHGFDNVTQAKRGINISGRYISVRDSLIEEIKQGPGNESYAIEVQDAPGPVWLENNGLSGAGMSLFIGAGMQPTPYVNPGAFGGIVSRNDYYWKKPEWYLQRVAETPTLECLDGTQFANHPSSPTTCYTCTSGSWVADANCNNAINYEIKNLYEIKTCDYCLMENAWGSLSPYGDGSQQSWLNIKMSPNEWEGWNTTRFIGYNFRADHIASGPLLRGSIVPARSRYSGPIVVWNGLHTDYNPHKYRLETGTDSSGYPFRFGKLSGGVEIRHVTNMLSSDYVTGNPKNSDIYLPDEGLNEANDGPYQLTQWASFRDNLSAVRIFRSNNTGKGNTCAAKNDLVYSDYGEANFEVNAFWTETTLNGGACITTLYEETSVSNFGFANPAANDYRLTGAGTTYDFRAGQANDASDGKDMGVDHEILNDGLGGSDPTAGLGSWSKQYDVSVTAAGTTTATVEWDRPNASNSCNLYLYTDWARTSEHADTSGSNSDAGMVSAGHVTFNLGGNSALTTKTWYWFEIDCPTDSVKMVGSLFTN